MKGQDREKWQELCEQAAKEQDSQKLIELVRQINDLLDKKRRRLDAEQDQDAS